MELFRPLVIIAVVCLATTPVTDCQAQTSEATTGETTAQTETDLVDSIVDYGQTTLAVNDISVVIDDIGRLLQDVGMGFMEESFKDSIIVDNDQGIDLSRGMIVYGSSVFLNPVFEMQISDHSRLGTTLGLDHDSPEMKEQQWFDGVGDLAFPMDNLVGIGEGHGVISGDRFLACDPEKKEWASGLLTAPSLSSLIDETSRQIINQSGFTLIGSARDVDLDEEMDMAWFIDNAEENLTEAELEWAKQFRSIVGAAERGFVGLKYNNDKTLEFRSRALIGSDQSFDELVDLNKTSRAWKPDLGLEAEQLVMAAGIQMDAFRSSAGPRVIPYALADIAGSDESYSFFRGNMLRMLLELGGDSWNELTAARLAMYLNDESEAAGQLAILCVVDSNDPEKVLVELRRLSQLTSPMVAAERADIRADEIRKLIQQLTSDDDNVAARAETRLRLAGSTALAALEEASRTSDPVLQRRTTRLIRRIKAISDGAKGDSGVSDPWFWTTLNPGLHLNESTGSLDGCVIHTIEITPDPSKTDEEVAHASGIMAGMFGPLWNSVQVVQVENHFVFMIGSDTELLKRTVAGVKSELQVLSGQFDGNGNSKKRGQVQLFANVIRLAKIFDPENSFLPKNTADTNQVCWLGLDMEKQAVSFDVLIPVVQVIPFIGLGF